MTYTLKQSGLSVKKGKVKGEWSVYKYSVPLLIGIKDKATATTIMMNQYYRDRALRS